jgi:hypothetical protein
MKVKWDGEGRLHVGTYARVVTSEHEKLGEVATGKKRHFAQALTGFHSGADSDRTTAVMPQNEVWIRSFPLSHIALFILL